jgi:hypothetical protein
VTINTNVCASVFTLVFLFGCAVFLPESRCEFAANETIHLMVVCGEGSAILQRQQPQKSQLSFRPAWR